MNENWKQHYLYWLNGKEPQTRNWGLSRFTFLLQCQKKKNPLQLYKQLQKWITAMYLWHLYGEVFPKGFLKLRGICVRTRLSSTCQCASIVEVDSGRLSFETSMKTSGLKKSIYHYQNRNKMNIPENKRAEKTILQRSLKSCVSLAGIPNLKFLDQDLSLKCVSLRINTPIEITLF